MRRGDGVSWDLGECLISSAECLAGMSLLFFKQGPLGAVQIAIKASVELQMHARTMLSSKSNKI